MIFRSFIIIIIIFYSKIVLSKEIPIIVISAGKSPQSKSIVGSDIHSIDENQISESNEFFIGDIINQSVSGMSMFQSGGYGTVTGIQMRGLPGRYSTIYIDGVKMSDPSTPDNRYYGVNQIPANTVEKIEVLKGTHGSLYGSNAISGTIHILTKKASEEGVKQNIILAGGLDNWYLIGKERNFNYNILGKKNLHDFALNINGFFTEGDSAMTDNREKDLYRSESVSAKHGYQFNENLRIENNLNFIDSLLEYDEPQHYSGGWGADTSSQMRQDLNSTDDYEAIYNMKLIYDKGKHKNQLIMNSFRNERGVNNYDQTSQSNYYGYRDSLNFIGEYNFNLDTKIIYGLDNEYERANFDTWATAKNTLNEEYIISQYTDFQFRPFNKIYGTLGLRRDEHTIAGEYFSGRATFAYKKNNNTKYRTSFGNGIKFPTLNDYFYDTNMQNTGALKPEQSWGIDVGLDKFYEHLNLELNLTAFILQYEDHLAGWAGSQNEIGTTFAINNQGGKIKNKGIEMSIKKLLKKDTTIDLNYSFIDGYDGEDCDDPADTEKLCIDEQGVLVPKHQITSSIKKNIKNFNSLGNLNLILNTRWVGERRDYGNANTNSLHGYNANFHDVILGDYINFDFISNLEVNDKTYFITLKNVLGAEFEEGYMYRGQERALNFGVKTEF